MPPKIHILQASVSNQIAAGEVVERPASVVKELAENSLDAGASRVEVELEGGGQRLIRVTDDGSGMGREDLALAVKRHATSKLSRADELPAISSFGFRGEALPSIASVSRFRLASREAGSAEAWQIQVTGGAEGALEPAALAQGTLVEVRELFFNTPARLKFLKAASTETSRVQQELLRLALAHPACAFRLRLDGKISMDFRKAAHARERAGQALGSGFLGASLDLDFSSKAAKVRGWAGLPGQHRSNRSGQHLFVNSRPVEHRLLGFTLSQAYGSLIPHGRHAVAVVFVELEGGEVDVNVHPAKREVRFRDERGVLDAVRHAVAEALGKAQLMAHFDLNRAQAGWAEQARPLQGQGERDDGAAVGAELARPNSQGLPLPELSSAPAPHQSPSPWAVSSPEPGLAGWPVPLAQLHRSYLLCQDEGSLVVVDQHAAHERVLYEALCQSLEKGEVKSQRLLLPQKLSLGPAAAARLRTWAQPLLSLGLEIQDLGEGVFYLLSIPSFMKNVQVPALLQDLLDEIGEELESDPLGAFRREVAAQMACKAAVKAGDALNLDEMNRLMSELSRCVVPWSCPHGRPPFVRLPLAELEKYFERR